MGDPAGTGALLGCSSCGHHDHGAALGAGLHGAALHEQPADDGAGAHGDGGKVRGYTKKSASCLIVRRSSEQRVCACVVCVLVYARMCVRCLELVRHVCCEIDCLAISAAMSRVVGACVC